MNEQGPTCCPEGPKGNTGRLAFDDGTRTWGLD